MECSLKWIKKIAYYLGLAVLIFFLLITIGGAVYLFGFNSVRSTPTGPAAVPILSQYELESWEQDREDLRDTFVREIYGPYPDQNALTLIKREVLVPSALNDKAIVEQITLKSDQVETLNLIVVRPKNTKKPAPILIGQNFCGNHNSFPFSGISKPSGFYHASMCDQNDLNWLVEIIMGKHLNVPPLEKIIDAGYSLAGFYPGEIVPDSATRAPEYLEKVGTTGTISAWAWGFNRVAEFLATEPYVDPDKIALFGHSRFGKAALLASAQEPGLADLVISHQSGTTGASLGRSGIGESIEAITAQYPHWFDPNYRKYAADPDTLPVDQHQLIALVAPTPIILGNGQQDKWSDPQTAWRALEGATPIYKLYGVSGLAQLDLVSPNFENNLVFHMRVGPHGTRVSDWQAFLSFLDAHFSE